MYTAAEVSYNAGLVVPSLNEPTISGLVVLSLNEPTIFSRYLSIKKCPDVI